MTSAAREAGVTIPLGAVVAQLVAAMVARGDGGLDHSGLLKLAQELSGREADPSPAAAESPVRRAPRRSGGRAAANRRKRPWLG